mgnify:FL=1|jgi:multidrug resistance protein, MATE family
MPIHNFVDRLTLILSLAIPTSLCSIINILVEVINLKYISYLNNDKMVGGVGLGNMTQNLLGLSIILGFNSTIDTLVSQAAGLGDKKLCGVILNRGRFVLTVLFIPIIVILLNTKNILLAVKMDE